MKKILHCFAALLICILPRTVQGNDMLPVEEFIKKDYPKGIPCQTAEAFGQEAVGPLVEMLNDNEREPYWENIIVTLGCIGGEDVFVPISNFLEAHKGEVSMDTFAALSGVPTALGVLTNNGNEEALELLSNIAEDNYWREAKLEIIGDVAVTDETIRKSLMSSTIVALGYTGRTEAVDLLLKLKNDSEFEKTYQSELNMVLK